MTQEVWPPATMEIDDLIASCQADGFETLTERTSAMFEKIDQQFIDGYFGPAWDEIDDEKREAIRRAISLTHSSAEFSAAVAVILGDSTVEDFGRAVTRTSTDLADARDSLRGAVKAASISGMTEVEIARVSGLSRGTVRTYLGK